MKVLTIFGFLTILILAVSCNSTALSEIKAVLPVMENKPDGVYRGSYDLSGTPVKVTLDVTVQNQNIIAISIIRHVCSPIGKKAEKITERVIENQSLTVDAISGATGSSMAILKAVENAMETQR
ncbi:MAG: FMN-binding protein [Treponema sp.]|nr:FMN-binding protein [Treponema sp.]